MSDTELPEFIDEEVLRDIKTVDVPDEALLRCFVGANKPYLSKSGVAEMTDLSEEGVRKRLNSLVDRGVLQSDEAGKQTKIYWINHPRSRWPVPDDLQGNLRETDTEVAETVASINRLIQFTLLYGGMLVSLYALDWLSDHSITDGIFEVTVNGPVMPALSVVLLAILLYVSVRVSMLVDTDEATWPTLRRIYRRITH